MKTVIALIPVSLILAVVGCGGGGGGNVAAPTPTPTPSGALSVCANIGGNCDNPATVAVGGTQQFQVKVTGGGTPPAVNWSVNGGSANGTITSTGVYTAPAAFPSGKPVTITATVQSNSTTLTGTAFIVNNTSPQSGTIELGTTGGNSTDSVTSGGNTTCCSGTLGSLIQRGGTMFILSNNHVLDKSSFGTPGTDPVGQPGLVDNNCTPGQQVATLSEAAALKPANGSMGNSPSNVDASIAQLALASPIDTTGAILDLGPLSGGNLTPAPPSITLANPLTVMTNGEGVAKSGRSTGLTCSTIQSINTNTQVDYDSACGGPKAFTSIFLNQLVINGATFSAGGDSGSLVVTSDTARPVGLLFAGNDTSTTANPIQDVIQAFTNGSGTPVFVGGGDHAVTCGAVQQSASITTAALSSSTTASSLSAQARQAILGVQRRHTAELARDPAITSVETGMSADNPREGALLIHLHGIPENPIPAQIEGVRTRIISDSGASPLPTGALERAIAIKEALAQSMMEEAGVFGFGVGRSQDNPGETALVIYVEPGKHNAAFPAVINGVRTRIIEGQRFRAFGWGKATKAQVSCKKR